MQPVSVLPYPISIQVLGMDQANDNTPWDTLGIKKISDVWIHLNKTFIDPWSISMRVCKIPCCSITQKSFQIILKKFLASAPGE